MELLAVFAPLIAFLVAGIWGKAIGDKGCQLVTCTAVVVAALCSITLFFDMIGNLEEGGLVYTTEVMRWVSSGDFNVSWSIKIDTLSIVMMCVVNIVSACVHIYSIGYMSHDPSKGRFMAYLSLFTFAMLMLVTSDNMLQLFFGWEGVGVASYLLIGFWNHKHSANSAAQKAFVVNRVGDFGLALGIMATFYVFGSIEFSTIFDNPALYVDKTISIIGYDFHALTVICLLLFMGAVGKSAQLGLHTWLPDAMEGPTPVSALIHAATMVTAGVFLVARFSPLFEYAPTALMVVTIFGALTAFVAATIGMTQFDIKRVIAYSTMSQLGYMFFALGVSAYGAAMFHLMTHAFFKALLFLGAGSVIHAMSDEQDMRNMGGIWKKIPVTYALMWIGSLALAGFPFFAGYYSKDIVLEAAWADQTWFGNMAYWLGIAAAFMTAFYTWRLLFMTFHGEPRASQKVMSHVHESPATMTGPMIVLAVGAIFSGYVFYGGFVGSDGHHGQDHAKAIISSLDDHGGKHGEPTHKSEKSVAKKAHGEERGASLWTREYFWQDALIVLPENDTVEAAHNVPFWVKKMPFLMAVLGVLMAYLLYIRVPDIPAKVVTSFKPIHNLFFRKWYFDEIYDTIFVKNAFRLGRIFWISGDQNTIDRIGPNGIAGLSGRIAGGLSKFQSGYVYQYAFVMMITLIAIVSWFVFKADPSFYNSTTFETLSGITGNIPVKGMEE
ncbi:MAG: NADH-quinone oxidoreductase subunit L [Alphaproteobacteria bacterium]|nr:NADH-quinone oxidoreductase subunit L [Alphaproteobacteria bacterium]